MYIVARDPLLHHYMYMRYNEGLDMPGVPNLASARGHKGTRTNQGPCNVYITDKPALQYAQSTTFGLFVEASLFMLTSCFISTCFYFSKIIGIKRHQGCQQGTPLLRPITELQARPASYLSVHPSFALFLNFFQCVKYAC